MFMRHLTMVGMPILLRSNEWAFRRLARSTMSRRLILVTLSA